ncbi:MAG: Lrp/AsnC family transcriptional regulator [Candidatus Aenigmarchaeota archaeon]|nr:Lrp/AsnC family transcriptional regulator [Candidatus Aenigmarchaeota archaeon]
MHAEPIDKTDKNIINMLAKDGRLSYRKISQKAGVSVVTVMNRVRRLEKGGIIKGYSVVMDYPSLGYDLEALIEVRVSKGKLFDVENLIAARRNVFSVYDVTGNFDVAIVAKFQNRRQLDEFVKYLQTIPNVTRTHTRLILNTVKEASFEI